MNNETNYPDEDFDSENENDGSPVLTALSWTMIAMMVTHVILGLIICVCLIRRRHHRNKAEPATQMHIVPYVHKFDVEDIHIQKGLAAGGYRAKYRKSMLVHVAETFRYNQKNGHDTASSSDVDDKSLESVEIEFQDEGSIGVHDLEADRKVAERRGSILQNNTIISTWNPTVVDNVAEKEEALFWDATEAIRFANSSGKQQDSFGLEDSKDSIDSVQIV